MKRTAVLTAFLLAAGMALAAGDIRLYLNPSVTTGGKLLLGDIARIEADEATAETLGALPVDDSLHSDGYIDSREVRALLLSRGISYHVGIFGTACRVSAPADILHKKTDEPAPGEAVVKSGDRVDVILRKNGIMIQAPGTALDEGRLGEGVFIRTKNSRRVRGVITGRSTVEVNL
jgi:hypothetical protein